MKIGKLASLIAKMEGKKSQAKIGDIREILKCLKVICESADAADRLIDYLWMPKGIKQRKSKKKNK